MIILDRTLAENKQDFLWYIFNNLGCRELTLAYSYKDKDDNLRFSKWLKYEELEKYNPNDYIESVYCTKQQFIEKVSPQYAVILVGKDNYYGHPHQESLDTLEKYDINVLRTDREGDVKILSDGRSLRILNF